jgi:hypothetical protein
MSGQEKVYASVIDCTGGGGVYSRDYYLYVYKTGVEMARSPTGESSVTYDTPKHLLDKLVAEHSKNGLGAVLTADLRLHGVTDIKTWLGGIDNKYRKRGKLEADSQFAEDGTWGRMRFRGAVDRERPSVLKMIEKEGFRVI